MIRLKIAKSLVFYAWRSQRSILCLYPMIRIFAKTSSASGVSLRVNKFTLFCFWPLREQYRSSTAVLSNETCPNLVSLRKVKEWYGTMLKQDNIIRSRQYLLTNNCIWLRLDYQILQYFFYSRLAGHLLSMP